MLLFSVMGFNYLFVYFALHIINCTFFIVHSSAGLMLLLFTSQQFYWISEIRNNKLLGSDVGSEKKYHLHLLIFSTVGGRPEERSGDP